MGGIDREGFLCGSIGTSVEVKGYGGAVRPENTVAAAVELHVTSEKGIGDRGMGRARFRDDATLDRKLKDLIGKADAVIALGEGTKGLGNIINACLDLFKLLSAV